MLLNVIEKRHSPRAFAEKEISEEEINLLFEAARWAPSARNEQPWKYFYTSQKSENFQKFIACLVPINQLWAKNAQFIILSVGRKLYSENNSPNKFYLQDVGAANAYIALQACEMGFQVRQMGGFDLDKTLQTFEINPEIETPISFIAVGYKGEADLLPENMREMELKLRVRKPISDFLTKI